MNENHNSHAQFGHKTTLVFREGRSKIIHWDNLGIKHSYLVRKFFFFLTAYPFGVIEDILDRQWCEHHTNCLSWHTHLSTVWEKPRSEQTHFHVAFKCIHIEYNRAINQPNVGADVHLSTLQCCVHSQVNGVGGLTAVVLVDEH